jgi:hypothetical protein
MRFYILLVLVPAAAFAVSSTAAAAAVMAAWPVLRRAFERAASARARVISVVRLAPVAIGFGAMAAVSAALIRFEPRDTTETPGLLLCLAGALALVLGLSASVRTGRSVRAAMRCSRLLRVAGTRAVAPDGTRYWMVETDYPVAAVTGIFRTRLLLSTRILRECTAAEIDTIISHERAHVRRRDNLVRAAMLYLPDPLRFTRAGRDMELAWADAAEEAADEAAAGPSDERRALLASALVRVARMANTPMPEWVPGLAFYEGHNLDTRVRRLLGAARLSTHGRLLHSSAVIAVSSACVFAVSEAAGRSLHSWMELAVRYVP